MNLEAMYIQWNKPGTERQLLSGFTYKWNFRIQTQKQQNDSYHAIGRFGDGKNEDTLVKEHRCSGIG